MKNITWKEFSEQYRSGIKHFENYIFDSKTANFKMYSNLDSVNLSDLLKDELEPLKISFSNCEFYVNFHCANISIDVASPYIFFQNVQFHEGVGFFRCKFIYDLNLINVTINKDCSFDSFVFEKYTDFKNVNFNGLVSFKRNRATGPTRFIDNCNFKSNFNGGAFFDATEFINLDFRGSDLGTKLIEFDSCEFKTLALFRGLTFRNNIIFKGSDLTNCSFAYSNYEDALFTNCIFDFKNLVDENIFKGRINDDLQSKINSYGIHESLYIYINAEDIMSQYRMFEINFDKHKNFDLAGEFLKQRLNLDKQTHTFKFKKFPKLALFLNNLKIPTLRKIFLNLYKWSSGYGENYGKSLLWFFVILIIFSFVYLFTGISYANSQIWWWDSFKHYVWYEDFGCGMLYSLSNSFPFKKDPDLVKSLGTWTTTFSIIETFIQTILGTLFIISLRRKFKR